MLPALLGANLQEEEVLSLDVDLKSGLSHCTRGPFNATQFKMSDSEEDREISFTVKVRDGWKCHRKISVFFKTAAARAQGFSLRNLSACARPFPQFLGRFEVFRPDGLRVLEEAAESLKVRTTSCCCSGSKTVSL